MARSALQKPYYVSRGQSVADVGLDSLCWYNFSITLQLLSLSLSLSLFVMLLTGWGVIICRREYVVHRAAINLAIAPDRST